MNDAQLRLLDVTDVVEDVVPRGQFLQQVDTGRPLVIGNVFVDALAGEDEHPPEMIRVEDRVYIASQRRRRRRRIESLEWHFRLTTRVLADLL